MLRNSSTHSRLRISALWRLEISKSILFRPKTQFWTKKAKRRALDKFIIVFNLCRCKVWKDKIWAAKRKNSIQADPIQNSKFTKVGFKIICHRLKNFSRRKYKKHLNKILDCGTSWTIKQPTKEPSIIKLKVKFCHEIFEPIELFRKLICKRMRISELPSPQESPKKEKLKSKKFMKITGILGRFTNWGALRPDRLTLKTPSKCWPVRFCKFS